MSTFLLAAAAAATFNLSCDLHMKLVASHDTAPMEADTRKTFRLDLAALRWCEGDCRETKPIVRVRDTLLILIEDSDPRIDAYESLTINRESGRYDHHTRINESSMDGKGFCKPTPFTGFPASKF